MQFKCTAQKISRTHYDFADLVFDGRSFPEDILQDNDKWCEAVGRQRIFYAYDHHLLGHAHFLYDDPIAHHQDLQDDDLDIFWGDCGIAQFLIHLDDLAKSNFAHVHYDWSCS